MIMRSTARKRTPEWRMIKGSRFQAPGFRFKAKGSDITSVFLLNYQKE
jgi:hypothetical protein